MCLKIENYYLKTQTKHPIISQKVILSIIQFHSKIHLTLKLLFLPFHLKEYKLIIKIMIKITTQTTSSTSGIKIIIFF